MPFFNWNNCLLEERGILPALLPYEACERPEDFVADGGGIAGDVEPTVQPCRPKVQPVAAIIPTGDGDGLANKDSRIALDGSLKGHLGDVDIAVAHSLHPAASGEWLQLGIFRSLEIEHIQTVVGLAKSHHAVQRGNDGVFFIFFHL